MTFRITSPDALPLSYRRLVGGKATKLWKDTREGGASLQYARCVSRSLLLKFGIWRAREKPRPVVRDK